MFCKTKKVSIMKKLKKVSQELANETKTYKVTFNATAFFEVDEKRGIVIADKLGSRFVIS